LKILLLFGMMGTISIIAKQFLDIGLPYLHCYLNRQSRSYAKSLDVFGFVLQILFLFLLDFASGQKEFLKM